MPQTLYSITSQIHNGASGFSSSSVLYRVEWQRIIIEDGHQLIKGAAATRKARLEALRALRMDLSKSGQASSCWIVLEVSRAPKLRQSREDMRTLMNAIRAPPKDSLVTLVPKLIRWLD